MNKIVNVTGNVTVNYVTRFVNVIKLKYGDGVRSPKVKIKRLGKENVRNMDIRNVLTGNVRKMAAIFDSSVGGEQTTEDFVPDTALQEQILHFENFQGKVKTIGGTTTQCRRA